MIQQNFGTDKVIYDVFGGGGAITFECLLQGLDVRYNELNPTVGEAIQLLLSKDREFIKGLLLSRAEFFKLRKKEQFDGEDYLKLLVNSFGNNMKSYLYAEKVADIKYRLAKEIIEKHDVFGGYKQTETYKNTVQQLQQLEQLQRLQQLERLQQLGQLERLQQLQQLQQLQRLQQLERLQQLGQLERLQQLGQLEQLQRLQQQQQLQQLQQLEITNLDYRAFSDIEGAIFYLDPPYENTCGYHHGKKEMLFNHATFYDWACQMAQKNIVLISSYEISDERFEMVYEFKKARSTLNGGIDSRKSKTERLFMVKGIKEWQQ